MTRFKGLPHWCMTGTRPAFYDTESATTIEMVAKLYGSYTELVEDYNKYVDEINKAILDFETGVISDTTSFKETITKIVHDYIKMIDDKVKIQDATIAEAVDYMKNNIIYAITETVNEMKTSGELAEIVVEGFNDAVARITTLEENLTGVDAKAEKNIDDILSLNNRVKLAENTVSTMEGKVNQSTYTVDSLSKEVGNVKSDMNTLSNDVASVKSTNTNINRNMTTLIGRVEDTEADITTLEGRVETLENTPGGTGETIQKSAISISGGGEKEYPINAWSWTPINFTATSINLGDGFSYSTSDNAITILKDMNVRIDAQIAYFGTPTGEFNCRLMKNNDSTAIAFVNQLHEFNDGSCNVCIPGVIQSLKAGDKIKIEFSGNAGTYKINQNNYMSRLTICEI